MVIFITGVGRCSSPFNDNFNPQSRDSPAGAQTPGSSSQPQSNEGSWNEDTPGSAATATAAAAPAVNGRRSVGQGSCSGDFTAAGAADIFDPNKDILTGASFKVLAKVIPNPVQVLDSQQVHRQQLHQLQVSGDDDFEIPKSNSFNIFSIKDDPFDDDFFSAT